MGLILCIETGTEICSVALALDGKTISLTESDLGRNHASNLGVFIDEILKASELKASDLDAVAVSKGPGSYTGLRIGISTAKALCYALDIPLISIGSLDSLCAVAIEDFEAGLFTMSNSQTTLLCPMIDARRMEVYTGLFDTNIQAITPVEAHILNEQSFDAQLTDNTQIIAFGDGAKKSLDVIDNQNFKYIDIAPSARGLTKLAEQYFQQQKFEDTAYFEPLYLKDFMVHKSKKSFF